MQLWTSGQMDRRTGGRTDGLMDFLIFTDSTSVELKIIIATFIDLDDLYQGSLVRTREHAVHNKYAPVN